MFSHQSIFLIVWFAVLILLFALPLIARHNFKSKSIEGNKYTSTSEIKGIDLITEMFIYNKIETFDVNIIGGIFSDNYNFRTRILNLSSSSYHGSSLSNHAIACHEAGHAVQFRKNFFWAVFSKKFAPVAHICSLISFGLILLWIFTGSLAVLFLFFIVSVILFLYHVVVLIIEWDASRRALKFVKSSGYFDKFAYKKCRSVLISAWLTYWAVAFNALVIVLFAIGIYVAYILGINV